ncbi:MAG: OmpL47-type beta-barrel domain-containing protein [Brevinema sp.]
MKKQWVIAAVILIAIQSYAQDVALPDDLATNNTVETPVGDEVVTTESQMMVTDTNIDSTNNVNTIVEPIVETNTVVENVGYTLTRDDILFASPFARFGIEGMDTESGVKDIFVSLDGSTYKPYKGAISFDKEGEHSINYKFVDHVGNVSYSKTYDIIIDATAPRITEIQFDPKPYTASGYTYVGPNSYLSFKLHDDTTGIAYVEFATNDTSEWTRFTTNTTLSNLGITNTALTTIRYQALDMVSNVSSIKTKTVFVDATAPTVNIFADKVFEKDGIKYISSKSIITVTALDSETDVNKIFYAVNDGEFQEYDADIAIQLKKAGNYDVKVKAVDVVGNESKEVLYSVVVDMLAPTGDVSYLGDKESSTYDQSSILGSKSEPLSQEVMTETPNDVAPDSTTMEPAATEVEQSVSMESGTPVTSTEVPAGTEAPVTQ